MIQIARYYWRSRFTGQLGRGEDVSRRGGEGWRTGSEGGGGGYSFPHTPAGPWLVFMVSCLRLGSTVFLPSYSLKENVVNRRQTKFTRRPKSSLPVDLAACFYISVANSWLDFTAGSSKK